MNPTRRALPLLILLGLVLPGRAGAGPQEWRRASDVGVWTLVAASIGLPLADGDQPGAWQALGSFAAASLATEGLKATIHRERPDGSDDKSFPSGHTSRSFAAAASLLTRQGRGAGLPAVAVAALVGVARVEGDKHYWSDVAAGAAIGSAAGWLVTTGKDDGGKVAVHPWAGRGGGGVEVVIRF